MAEAELLAGLRAVGVQVAAVVVLVYVVAALFGVRPFSQSRPRTHRR